jgi:hypothetical protein
MKTSYKKFMHSPNTTNPSERNVIIIISKGVAKNLSGPLQNKTETLIKNKIHL